MNGVTGQTQLYQGAVPGYEAPMQQGVQAHLADYSEVANAAGKTLDKGIKLLDFCQQLQEEDAQVSVATDRAKDYQNRMAKAAGTAGSFLNKDGSINADEVAKFNEQWAKRFRETRRTRFDGDGALQAKQKLEKTISEWNSQTETQVNADMLRTTKDIWETRLKIFEAEGDTAAMRGHLARGLEAGLLREDEVELIRIRMAKAAARAGGGPAVRSVEQLNALRLKPKEPFDAEAVTTTMGESTLDSMTFELTQEPHDLSNAKGLLEKGNINPYTRKVEHRKDGSIATVESFSVNMDGKEVLLPRVIDGKTVSMDDAIKHYEQTGEHLGKFDTPEHASDYAKKFHENQAYIYGPGAKNRKRPATFDEDPQQKLLNDAASQQFNTAMAENPFSDISLRTDGFRMMDSTTYDEVRAADVAAQRRGSITLDTMTGKDLFSAPDAASDATFGIVDKANALDGYSAQEYGSDLKQIAFRYRLDPQMAGLSKSELTKAIKDDAELEGGAERWFKGDSVAYAGFIDTEISKVLDIADGPAFKHFGAQVQSINNVSDIQGLVRSGVLDESFLKPMEWKASLDAVHTAHWWGGALQANDTAKELWKKYGDAYLRETGKEKGEGLKEHYDKFREWATQKGGIVEQEQKAYATAVKDIVQGRVTDALTEYFANGGTSEAEAIAYVKKSLKRPLADAEMGVQQAIAAERAKREETNKAREEAARKKAEEARERIRHYQTRSGEAKKNEERKVAAAKEAEKAATQREKDAATQRQKLAAPMKQVVKWDGGKDKEPFVTVPFDMYDELVNALVPKKVMGFPNAQGLGVVFAGGSGRPIPVRPGRVSGIRFSNGVMLQEWPRAKKREASELVNGVNKTIQFLPY